MVFKESWNIIAASPTDISIQPSTLTAMCSPAKPSAAISAAARCLGLCWLHGALGMLREQGGMGWGAQHHPRMLCVCVCSGPCQGLPSQRGFANCSCPGTGAKPGVRSRPADPAQRQRRRRGFGAEQVALVGVNAWLVQPASLRAALSRQLRQGGKRSWKKSLPENCQTMIHFSETRRLCLNLSYLFTKSSLSGAERFQGDSGGCSTQRCSRPWCCFPPLF